MSQKPTIRKRKIEDYKSDPENRNKGTAEGSRVIRQSYEQYGPGASLLADRDDTLVIGNQRRKELEELIDAGIVREIWEIETPPDVQVVLKRPDLDLDDPEDTRARGLSIADNITSDKSHSYDIDMLIEDHEAGLLDGLLRPDEIETMMAEQAKIVEVETALNDEQPSKRQLGDVGHQVKIVLYVDEVSDFERAIQLAKERLATRNRGETLLEIARHYLESFGESAIG